METREDEGCCVHGMAQTHIEENHVYEELTSNDEGIRQASCAVLRTNLLAIVDGVHTHDDLEQIDARLMILQHLSIQCPLQDVRLWCSKLLHDLKERSGISPPLIQAAGPSAFIPTSEIVPVNTDNSETRMLYTDAFIQNGRLDHLTQIMGFHPQYLSCFHRTHNFLMREEGPLPFHYRHYIAIIAACRHQCSYLVHIHTTEFLQKGGDPTWLESLDNVPEKLRNLQEMNKLLAHKPWLLSSSHIEKLCRCGSNSWSMSELMHAIVLLAHFHGICSAVFGCGINFEIDDHAGRLLHSDGETSSDSSDGEYYSSEDATVDSLLERLKTLKDNDDYTEEEGLQAFKTVESQTAELNAKGKSVNRSSQRSCTSPLIENPSFTYEDFVKRQEHDIQTFRASDYSWEAQGFSIANRFYADIGNYLDEKFNVAKEFTYYTMGDKYENVNTQAFRTGVWNYIHCMMGIMHDDYDYSQVNSLLERSLKSYIKVLACYPERITKRDFDGVMKGFKYSEKIHVNIILLEAKMQAELLYALRAVTQFMT